MMKLRSVFAALAFFCLTAILSTGLVLTGSAPANAQGEDDPAPDSGEATNKPVKNVLIVTARRRDERLIDAPVAITPLTGAQLDDYSITNFADMATQVPLLIAGRAASGSSASIFLRGVGSTALSAGFDQSVSFVVDGMPMSRGREINLSQYDVQRVEVLKGPQALFFGKNTTGGLISVITNGPTDEFEAGIKAGFGFYAEEKYGEGYVSGPITDKLRARFAFRVSDSEGPFENTAADTYPTPLGFERHSNSKHRGFGRTLSGRLTLDYQPTDNFKIELKTSFTDQKDGGPTDVLERICGGGRMVPAFSNGVPPSPNADCLVNGASDSSSIPSEVAAADYRYARDGEIYARLKSGYGILTMDLDTSMFDITSITAYYRFKQTDNNNVSGEHYPANFTQLADYRQVSEELRFQSKFDSAVNVLFGAFYSHNKFIFNTDAYIFPVPISPVTDTYVTFKRDNGFSGDSFSLFGELTYDITDQLELSGGARWSHEKRVSYQESLPAHLGFVAFFPPGIRLDDKFSDNNVSPQVTLRYKPSENTTIYVSYKQGFKTGGFNISQSLTPGASLAAGQYGSETAEGGEIGLRTIQFGGDVSFNTTAYYYVYKDLQVQNFDPVTIGQVVANAGKLHTRGIEADLTWDVSDAPGLSFRLVAAYNNAKYKDYVGQCYSGQTIMEGCTLLFDPVSGAFTSQDYSGRTPPKAPRFAGKIGASYETPVGNGMRFEMLFDVIYTSKYNFTDTLRPDASQKGYARVDAAIFLHGEDDGWSVGLIGRNLTNELVVTSANDIPFTGGTGTGTNVGVLSDMSAYIEYPREIIIEASFRF